MKRFYKFLMPLVAIVAMALPWNVSAQVTVSIGDGGTSTSSYLPTYEFYNYSLTQQIYTAEEIGMAGTITSISFYTGGSGTRTLVVYMVNTTLTGFSGSSAWITPTAADQVFSGSVTYVANGWTTLTLTTPFTYDGSSNLAVIVDDNTGSYVSSISKRVFTPTAGGNCAIRVYSDGTNYDALAPTSYSGTMMTTKNQIQLEILPANMSCYPVRALTASNIGPWTCTLSWVDTSNTGATYSVMDMADSSIIASGITDTTVDLTNLTSDHAYTFGVYADCGGGDESIISRTNVHTLVSCPNPTQLTLDSITPSSAYIHWTPGFDETEWYLVIGDSVVGSITDTFYTITDLNPNTIYNLKLRALCGAGDSSIVTSLTIHTLAGDPISVFPYTCGFEYDSINEVDQAADWMLENGTQTNQWYVGTPGAHNGTKGLFISNDNGATNAYSTGNTSHVYAYAVFNFSETGEYTISYDWRNQGESNYYDWIRVFLAPASQDFVAGSAQPLGSGTYGACTTAVAPGWAELSGRTSSLYTLAQHDTWQNVATTFTITNPGTYKLVFMWSNDASGGSQPPASVDNINISINTCPAPVDLVIDSLMPTAIDVHWTALGEETEWALRVGDSLITGITDTFYTITNLEQYTLYTMRVYAVCGADDTSLASPAVTGRTTVSCPWPTNLTVATAGDTANFSWSAGDATAWELVYGPIGFNPNNSDDIILLNINQYQATGLATGFYDAYVRTDCGGDYSLWTGPVDFSIGVTYMNMATSGTDTLRSCAAIVYDDGGATGSYSASCQSTLVILPGTSGSAVVISGTSYTESTYDYLTIYEGEGTNGTQVWSDYGVSATQTFGPFTGSAFTVVFHSDGSVQYSGFQINVGCHSVDCPYANEIHAEQVSSGSAILGYSIVGLSDTSTYDDLTLVLTSPTDTLTLHPNSDNQAIVTGLDSNTTYTAQLFTSCGGVETDVVSCTFSTRGLPCAMIDPLLSDTVQIGNGTNTSYYIPLNNFYNYSYTQQLVLASEMNGAMNISGIDFDYAYSSPSTVKTDVSIYMANVSQSSLSSSFVPYSSSFTLVYTGPMNCTQGWNHFEFDTPFSYDGTSNLLIVVHDNSGDYDGSSYTFNTHSATGMARYLNNDGSAYDIQTVSGGNSYSYRNNMKLYSFGCQLQATCAAPLVVLDSTTTTSAIVNIYPGFQETSWTVEYRLVGDTTWTMSGTATATSYTVTGLQSGKHYEIRVSSVCDNASFGTTVAATTQCAVVAVTPTSPYFENFEGGAPVCWSQEYVHGQYDWRLGSETYVYHNSTYQHGDGAAELYQQSNTSDTAITKLITDAFDFTALPNGARLRFYNAQLPYQTYGQPTLYLYYRTAANGDWTVFDSIVTAVTDFTQHEFILPNSTAAPYYQIAFEGHCPYGYGLNVDDVLVEAAPNCSRPIIDTIVANGATATINWTGNANSYTVSYHNFYDTVAPWTTVNVTGTTATISGLTTGTYYEVTVTGDCGAVNGQSDPSAPEFFYVPCAGQAIPYTENFNSYTSDLCYIANSSFTGFDNYPYVQLPNCWMFPNQSHQGISPAALLFNDPTNAFPTNCLWINARTGRDHYSVLPLMGAPIDTLVLMFDYILSSETIVIGVVTDPNDLTTFVGLETLTASSGSVEHYFSTDNFTWNAGQDYYIAFHTFGSYYAFIDNIEVIYQPHCMKVANLHQVSANTSSITLDWTNSSTGGTPMAYQISYTAQGSTTPSYIISTSKPATISGLDTLSYYTVAVRPICGVGDTAFWSDELVVSTAICDGGSEITNYNPTSSATTSSYGPIGYSLYNYSYVQTIIDSADLTGLTGEISAFAFNVGTFVSNSSTMYNNMTVYMANVSETDLASGFIHPDSTHLFQKVIDSASFNYTESGWQIHSLDSNFTWDGHSNLLISVKRDNGSYSGSQTFSAHTATASKMRYAYRDGSPFDINTITSSEGTGNNATTTVGDIKLINCGTGCAKPVITSVVAGEDNFVINYVTDADSVEIAVAENFDPAATGVVVAATGSYTFSGLNYSTLYSIAVRAHCEEGAVSDWALRNDSTLMVTCGVPTGLQATGSTYSTVSVSWTPAGDETAWSVRVYNTAYDQTYTATTTSYTIPNLVYTEGSSYNVSVRALCGQNANIEGDWCDPITVNPDQCQPVTGIAVTDVTASSAVVSWTAAQNTTGYTVQWGVGNWTSLNDAETATVTTNTYTINNLDENTQYSLFVVNNCTQTIASTDNQRVTFTTTEGVGIADVENGSFVLSPNPASTSVTLSLNGFNGAVKVEMVDMNGRVSGNWTVTDGQLTINLAGYAQGAYFVRVTGEQQTAVRKLIVR